MPVTYEEICEYHLHLSAHQDPVLLRMEEEARRDRFPIIGPAAGRLLYLLTRIAGARTIFELGSGYGYSTLWFARAVRENGGGTVHHTVWDDALQARARTNIREAGYDDLVEYHLGEAVDTLRRTPGPYDIIFNDIDKEGYPDSLPVMKQNLRPGGLIIIDNMLWQGRIFNEADQDESTRGVRRFTRLLSEDKEFTFQLLPIRDGLIVARKQD